MTRRPLSAERAAPLRLALSLLFLLCCRPCVTQRIPVFTNRAQPSASSFLNIASPFEGITDNLLFSGGANPFGSGLAGRASPFGPQGAKVDPKDVEPLTGDQWEQFKADVNEDLDSAAITSAALNLASGIVYTVSGALATASVGLSFTTIIPLFFFGIFGLGQEAVAFVGGLSDYKGKFATDLVAVLEKINGIQEKIKTGGFIADMESHLTKVKEVRAMIKDLRGSSPMAKAFR